MISVNNQEYEWNEGQTVDDLINLLKDTDALAQFFNAKMTVVINGSVVFPEEYGRRAINDLDEIRIYPMIYGG